MGTGEIGLENQIDRDREIGNVEENQNTITAAPEKTGGSREKAATRRRTESTRGRGRRYGGVKGVSEEREVVEPHRQVKAPDTAGERPERRAARWSGTTGRRSGGGPECACL